MTRRRHRREPSRREQAGQEPEAAGKAGRMRTPSTGARRHAWPSPSGCRLRAPSTRSRRACPSPPGCAAPATGPGRSASDTADQETAAAVSAPRISGLLEAPDRDEWQKPDLIMDELADRRRLGRSRELGAGGGWFTIRLARRVGPNGVVYAEDIQPLMVEAIDRRVQRENLTNVRQAACSARDRSTLPPKLDAVLIVDAAITRWTIRRDPEDIVTLFGTSARSLKPQGCFGVVDFLPGGGGPGPAPEERVDPETVIETASAAGLRLARARADPAVSVPAGLRQGRRSRCAPSIDDAPIVRPS